jgi:hypothetical protein
LNFEVLIGSSYDVILGQKHVYGTKALLGKKSDPSVSPDSSHATTPMTLDPLPAAPRRTPPASRNLEGPGTKPPDADTSKASSVCAVVTTTVCKTEEGSQELALEDKEER